MTNANPYPRALPVPEGEVVPLTRDILDAAIDASRKSPRGRMIQPFHKRDECVLHRMLNCIQPGSYIPPHRHSDPAKDEAIVLLRGKLGALIFNDEGQITATYTLETGSENWGIDLIAGVYHTFIALTPDTIIYEIKSGPYTQATDKDFASWAPKEGHPEAADYLAHLEAQFS